MRGYTYHVAPTVKPGVITLRPTKSTYAKAFMPTLVIWAGIAVVALVAKAVANDEQENTVVELDPDHE